jgi:hypothetical protein
MRPQLATLAFIVFLVLVAHAEEGETVTLTLPHRLQPGETAWIELSIGSLARGAELDISTTAGQFLGAISPFGIRSGQQAGTYTVPVPNDVLENSHVSVRLWIVQDDRPPRPPTATEVKSVRLKISATAK